MGKKYLVIEVEEHPNNSEAPNEIMYPFLLIPPILSIFSLAAIRVDGDFCNSHKVWILAIIDMVITLATTLGVFFGVSYLAAVIPFIFFLWSGLNLIHGIIGDRASNLRDFILDTQIDIALFFCILFLAIGGITEIGIALQLNSVADRSIANSVWLVCIVCILHFSFIFMFAYLNVGGVGENSAGFWHFVLTLFYILPALFYIGFSALYIVKPFWAMALLVPIGANQIFFYLTMGVTTAFMIVEGILLIVGHGEGCARFGILQGILNFILAAGAVVSILLSFHYAPPLELHIKSASDWEAVAVFSQGEVSSRKIHCYLENDIDFHGKRVTALSLKAGDFIDGQGHKLINGKSVGNKREGGFFSGPHGNDGRIQNLTLEYCMVYREFYSGGMLGAFTSENRGIIENCHAIETYVYYNRENYNYSFFEPTIYVGGIAGVNSGKIINCSFENSDLNAAFPYSITWRGRASCWEIAYNAQRNAIITDCYFLGTHGEGTVDYDKSFFGLR